MTGRLDDERGVNHECRISIGRVLAFAEALVADQLGQGGQGIRLKVGAG